MRSPVYVGERDVMAVAPDGRIAAAAIHWLDAVNGIGYFESVGTHPDFQRLGLGRAVLAESMRRMQAAGMTHASVCCEAADPRAVAFYQSCGFQIVNTLLMYCKEISD
jgi:ribosomal protein S18 acetylase RimI-like enzyme